MTYLIHSIGAHQVQFGSLRSTNALDPLEIRTSHVRSICHESLNKRPVNPAAVLKIFQVLLEVRFFYGKVHSRCQGWLEAVSGGKVNVEKFTSPTVTEISQIINGC